MQPCSVRNEVVSVFGGPAELQERAEQTGASHGPVSRGRADHPQRTDLPDRTGAQQALQR